MIITKDYDQRYVPKMNRRAILGAKLLSKTSNGLGLIMGTVCALVISIFGVGMPLDLMIFDPTPHVIGGLAVAAPFLLTDVGFITAGLLGAYAKATAIRSWDANAISEVQDKYLTLSKTERQMVQPLVDRIFENPNGGGKFVTARRNKFNEIYEELEAAKVKRFDNSDLTYADELLALMRNPEHRAIEA